MSDNELHCPDCGEPALGFGSDIGGEVEQLTPTVAVYPPFSGGAYVMVPCGCAFETFMVSSKAIHPGRQVTS